MPKKVLIVDDEEDILWGLSEELSRHNLEVDTASNGSEALEKIKNKKYDFLITDIRMPGLSGSELLLEAQKIQPDLKVIVMTAYGSEEVKEDVLSKGAISYLEKPFDFEQLLDIVEEKAKAGEEETISKLSLVQFLQLVSMEGQSCEITVATPEGKGKIYFIEGELVNAHIGNLKGEKAFAKIFEYKDSKFNVNWTTPKVKREIEKPLHALLLRVVAKQEEIEAEQVGEEIDLGELSKLLSEEEKEEAEEVEKEELAPEAEIEEEKAEEVELPSEVEEKVEEEIIEGEEEEEITLEQVESLLESIEEGEEVEEEQPVEEAEAKEIAEEAPVVEEVEEAEEEEIKAEEKEKIKEEKEEITTSFYSVFEDFVKDLGDIFSLVLISHSGKIIEKYEKISTGIENIPNKFGPSLKTMYETVSKSGLGELSDFTITTNKYNILLTKVKDGEYFLAAVIPLKTMKAALIKLRMKTLAQEIAKNLA
ncbi:MAG: response regulator [Candidatus Hydrothermae bacterium]|nr:response regulator [Candidatus Hydrothermae bacterium]